MRISMNRIKNLSTLICIIMIITYAVHLFIIYQSLPEIIPSHFDFMGRPDSYGNRLQLIAEPLIALMIVVIMELVCHFPSMWNYPVELTEENREFLFGVTLIMVSIIKVIITALLLYIGLCSMYSFLPVMLIYVFVIMLLSVCFGSIFIMWRGQ